MLEIGSTFTKTIVADERTIKKIAEVSGDMNPIHLDKEYAEHSMFGRRIAHGLFCINAISMIIGNHLPGNGTILLSQNFQYIKPVYIDDQIEVTVTIVNCLPGNKYTLRTLCKNQMGDIVLDGESVVRWEDS
ncbi:MAG: MaoC family dehydratase [Lachnospiraceae bacterium]|nr:MaoC family dehydratase [Lachnospiraceae bacterium]